MLKILILQGGFNEEHKVSLNTSKEIAKAFKKLNNLKIIRLKNCKILGETSIALEINHTLDYPQHKKKILILKQVIDKIFKI